MNEAEILRIAKRFGITDPIVETEHVTNGHINLTYLVTFGSKRYIVQKINRYVFGNPEAVMNNIDCVTHFLRKKIREDGGDPERETLRFLRDENGKNYIVNDDGSFWRISVYIDGTTAYNSVEDIRMLYNAGVSFGLFQKRLADFPMDTLYETIPDFHNTEKRFNNLFDAIQEDPLKRASEVKDDIEYFKKNFELAKTFNKLLSDRKICLRVTHNDTKYNNILIDDKTGKALCVIDLDTVMPGLAAFDFGDAIRFAASSAAEDEKDLSKVYLDIEKYEAFTKGFIGASEGFFTDTETEYMALGARMMTLETAARFLEDYIRGDKYFRTHYSGQNLVRSRCQAQLARSMEKEYDTMRTIVEKYK